MLPKILAAMWRRYDLQNHGSSLLLSKFIWKICAVRIAITQQR